MDVTIPLVLMVAAFYLLVILPTKRRQERAIEIDQNVKPGVEIVTTAGLYGTVVSVEDTSFRLEVAPGVTCKYAKAAILRVVTPESEAKEAAKAEKLRNARARGKARKPPTRSTKPAPKAPPSPPAQPASGDEPGPKTL